YVFLALEAKRTLCARSSLASCRKQIVPSNGFRADEVVLQIGVNRARRLRRLRSRGHGPRTALVFPRGEEADQAEQFVAFPNQPDQSALVQSVTRKKIGGFCFIHLGKFGLNLTANRRGPGIGPLRYIGERIPLHSRGEVIAQR